MDSRTGFKIFKGRTITLVFIVPDGLTRIPKMGMPEGCGLVSLVQQMQETSDRIGVNIEFQPTNQCTSRPRTIRGMCGGTGTYGGHTCALCGGRNDRN